MQLERVTFFRVVRDMLPRPFKSNTYTVVPLLTVCSPKASAHYRQQCLLRSIINTTDSITKTIKRS